MQLFFVKLLFYEIFNDALQFKGKMSVFLTVNDNST